MKTINAEAMSTGVTSSRIKPNHLLTDILKNHVLVASSESNFLESGIGLSIELLTVWISLTPQSRGFAFFQRQLARAVSYWDSKYARQLQENPAVHETEPIWGHPPKERILLVFDGIEHVQEGAVYDFLFGMVRHPLENTAVLLLTPNNVAEAEQLDPEEAGALDEAAAMIQQGRLGELEAVFAQRGVRFLSPAISRPYLQLFQRISQRERSAFPILQIVEAGMLWEIGETEKAHRLLHRAGKALETGAPSGEQRWALGEVCLLQALVNMSLGNSDFLVLLQKADLLLPNGSSMITRHSGMCLGNSSAMIYPGYKKQDVHRILDAMHEAEPYLLRLTHGYGHGREHLATTEVYYYTDEFRKAKSNAQRAISRAVEYGQWDLMCGAHYILMRIAIAQGDYRQTITHIDKMKEYRLLYDEKNQHILHLPDLAEAEFYLKLGEGQRVAPWLLEETQPDSNNSFIYTGKAPLIRASCLMDSGKLLEALDAVEKASQRYSNYKQFMLVLQAYILKAVLYSRIGEPDLAVMHLRLAYEMGSSNDLIMLFAGYGKHMAALAESLREAKGHDIPARWIDRLQQRSETYSRNMGRLRSRYLSIETGASSLEHLTKREREALELLCEGLSNQQIADRMGIKVTSLKTSLQRVYEKIGAENRSDAVRLWLMSKK